MSIGDPIEARYLEWDKKEENFEKMNFLNLYEALLININLQLNLNWENVYKLLNDFMNEFNITKDNKESIKPL